MTETTKGAGALQSISWRALAVQLVIGIAMLVYAQIQLHPRPSRMIVAACVALAIAVLGTVADAKMTRIDPNSGVPVNSRAGNKF